MDDETLTGAVNELWENREKYIEAMNTSPLSNGVDVIIKLITETVG